jgi:endonuclease/exonuclease/phosphatase family metal-dependent hydrolase
VSSGAFGTSLTWSGGAPGYTVQQATDAAFRTGTRTYAIRGKAHQLTPYGLTRGATYWFRVRAVSGSAASAYTSSVHATAAARGQAVRVLTYNIMQLTKDGTREGGQTIAPWSQRRLGAARLVKQALPDVVAIQEGSPWVGAPRGARQVDDLVSALGGTYALARTEVPPNQRGYFRTGRYILYRPDRYAPVGAGDHWQIGNARWAAYQVLRNRQTGATFLFVAVHLSFASGSSGDTERENETKSLLKQARAYASARHLPVVYAGDFNSHEGRPHTFDGPGIVMHSAHVADASEVAQSFTNRKYNSANQYLRTPPAYGRYIDRVFGEPGVALTSWRSYLTLSGGRFAGVIPSDHNPVAADVVIPF